MLMEQTKKIDHFTQRREPYTVHVVQEQEDVLAVYIQKDGYPMMYAFGIPSEGWNVEGAFMFGWNFIADHQYLMDDVFDDKNSI